MLFRCEMLKKKMSDRMWCWLRSVDVAVRLPGTYSSELKSGFSLLIYVSHTVLPQSEGVSQNISLLKSSYDVFCFM